MSGRSAQRQGSKGKKKGKKPAETSESLPVGVTQPSHPLFQTPSMTSDVARFLQGSQEDVPFGVDIGRSLLLSSGSFVTEVLRDAGELEILATSTEMQQPPISPMDSARSSTSVAIEMSPGITAELDEQIEGISQTMTHLMSMQPQESLPGTAPLAPSATTETVERITQEPLLEQTPAATGPSGVLRQDIGETRPSGESSPQTAATIAEPVSDPPQEVLETAVRPQDMSVGEIQASLEAEPHVGAVVPIYPDPAMTIKDAQLLSDLVDSGLLESLYMIPASLILSCGTLKVGTAMTSCMLAPRDQLQMAVCGKVYSSLPQAGVDMQVFELLHTGYMILEDKKNEDSFSGDKLKQVWSYLDQEDMVSIVEILAQLMFSAERLSNPEAIKDTTPTELVNVMTELGEQYPEALVAYNMLFQVVKGGEKCIAPIPDLCRSTPALGAYVDKISSGTNLLRMADIPLEARSKELPTASILTATLGVSSGVRIPGAIPRPTPAPSAAVPSQMSRGIQPPVPRIPPTPSSLLQQGAPTSTSITRDTYRFKSALDAEENMRKMYMEISSQMNQILQGVAALTATTAKMDGRLTRMEACLGDILTHGSHRGLVSGAAVSRTLLKPSVPEAETIIASALPLAPLAANKVQTMIERIQKFTTLANDPSIIQDLKDLYMSGGEEAASRAITAQSFSTAMSRKRMIIRLSGMSLG